ncbi:hypothetical protein BCR41DRAFT_164379 [Lobosporangium transversale]|uniref:F-box domain-containing protein n=1 Tax=Lobosporangium transversale TaxID=64571 RepID=A0A1Y2GCK6_9FUNG|nr:hypothetical protein BCR41DRAFT_164379 [Lobosporangium transversale]ORZ07058.1 hypothetical protein BCR41DRAFT_164379 [Lobosporangium transversale]|eukprot:XP_021877854.1 hypothetical protein BCR41DRAFT_164379 [Lobosporangium transversale]
MPVSRHSRSIPPTLTKNKTNDHAKTHIKSYQCMLPTELWGLILGFIPTLDLFSLYNTSTYMRTLVAPLLVTVIASKSLRLFFYQEYVRRIGIKFVFDHYDLKRDRVVFRPQTQDHQHQFKCGLTLQSPQLEEIVINSMSNAAIAPHKIRCIEESELMATSNVERVYQSEVAKVQERQTRTQAPHEKGYQGFKNFLDKVCSVNIRNEGIHQIDGSRYCFLQDYPWSLEYQVSYEPFDISHEASWKGKCQKDTASLEYHQNDAKKKRERFFFDIREDLRAQTLGQTEDEGENTALNCNGCDGSSGIRNENYTSLKGTATLLSPSDAFINIDTKKRVFINSSKISSNSGARFFRLLRFECSMNFLDPKRATRNIIGRWVEGKVQRWKKVLTGKKQVTPQHHDYQPMISAGNRASVHSLNASFGIPPSHGAIGSLRVTPAS